jgi:hypothetical protein
MESERVRSVRIDSTDRGTALLSVVYEAGRGEPVVRRTSGRQSLIRDIAHRLARRHDLEPIWEDSSWLRGEGARPPVALYRCRS